MVLFFSVCRICLKAAKKKTVVSWGKKSVFRCLHCGECKIFHCVLCCENVKRLQSGSTISGSLLLLPSAAIKSVLFALAGQGVNSSCISLRTEYKAAPEKPFCEPFRISSPALHPHPPPASSLQKCPFNNGSESLPGPQPADPATWPSPWGGGRLGSNTTAQEIDGEAESSRAVKLWLVDLRGSTAVGGSPRSGWLIW